MSNSTHSTLKNDIHNIKHYASTIVVLADQDIFKNDD